MFKFKLFGKLIRIGESECDRQICSYFSHYLRYGPPDMSHAAFHVAERECSRWQEKAMKCIGEAPRHVEYMCEKLEREIRA